MPTYAASTTWFQTTRRANDTLKLSVLGKVNDAGVGVSMRCEPSSTWNGIRWNVS